MKQARRFLVPLPLVVSLLLFVLSSSNSDAWLTSSNRNGDHQSRLQSIEHSERYPRGEVIGSSGKIGTYLLNLINSSPVIPAFQSANNSPQYPQCQPAAATPRGVSPGCLSPDNTPIFACIPSSSISSVWDATAPHRRKDLVFLCNCIPSRHLNFDSSSDDDDNFTICILHFGVTFDERGVDKSTTPSQPLIPLLNTSPQSPATVIYGRHAATLFDLLKRDGVSVEIASSSQYIQMVAAKKLAWSSLFWLLCHDGNEPLTVKEVWERKSKQIYELVEEMIPALERLASEHWANNNAVDHQSNTETKSTLGTIQEVVDYLYSYSMSMKGGHIIPCLELALNEIQERNGVLLTLMMQLQSNNTNHRAGLPRRQLGLISRVTGEEYLERCLNTSKKVDDDHDKSDSLERVTCKGSNLQFLSYRTKGDNNLSRQPSVIIIGAGIIGSSLAYHLSRWEGIEVTVMEKSTHLLPKQEAAHPTDNEGDGINPGVATSSSFAWLNANDKSPLSYMEFNQLGMEVWRRHDLLKEYPIWCGALLRTAKQNGVGQNSRYVSVGPLNRHDVYELEPGIDLKDISNKSSEFYFYPEEGYVDPNSVVEALRVSAQRNGVHFIGEAEVVSLIRNKNGNIAGVEYTATSTNVTMRATADLVVVASGSNSASSSLGIGSERLPLAKQPGALTYVRGDSNMNLINYLTQPLKRIFVDTMNQSHMLRRQDGTLVIGGGKLIVGGTDTDDDAQDNEEIHTSIESDSAIGKAMIIAAFKSASPDSYLSNENNDFRVTKANRPISADGLPVVGFVEQGLYVIVTHSGITLAPLLGELASHEISQSFITPKDEEEILKQKRYGFQILDFYRPTRFTQK
jgi:glycine/D-amino acid oxidase-like deaminating enzyme